LRAAPGDDSVRVDASCPGLKRATRTNTTEGGGKKSLKERADAVQPAQAIGRRAWNQRLAAGLRHRDALIFGKVILVGEALKVGKGLERRALVWAVLGKSLIFAILLLVFHIVEEAIRLWFESNPLSEAFADLGGTLPSLLSFAAIFFVALLPFFASREETRILGNGTLWNLFLHSGEKRYQLIED
jgi:hypothetical protein